MIFKKIFDINKIFPLYNFSYINMNFKSYLSIKFFYLKGENFYEN